MLLEFANTQVVGLGVFILFIILFFVAWVPSSEWKIFYIFMYLIFLAGCALVAAFVWSVIRTDPLTYTLRVDIEPRAKIVIEVILPIIAIGLITLVGAWISKLRTPRKIDFPHTNVRRTPQ